MNALPRGQFSPRQFATIVGISEGSVRQALREGRIVADRDEKGRRLIPEAEIIGRFALELTSPVTQAATIAALRRNAVTAGVALGPDDDLISGAETYLRALQAEPSDASTVKYEPVRFEPKYRIGLVDDEQLHEATSRIPALVGVHNETEQHIE